MTRRPDISHPFTETVAGTLEAYRMTAPGDRILIGFSGGPDSTALARGLMMLSSRMDFTIALVHLNHGLRGREADRDEDFARDFARSFSLDLHVERCDVRALAQREKRSLEDAGRKARYALFKTLARDHGYTRTATGHHRDDHAEQVLLNLVRGTGPGGLRGISPVREDGIIRPLIRVWKKEITSFLDDINQPFVTDASNQDPEFLRNRVRHRLIPLMEKEFNPEIRAGLDRLSRIMVQEDDYMDARAEENFSAAVRAREKDTITLDADLLNTCHPAIFSRVVRKALGHVKEDLRRITRRHLLDIRDLTRFSETGKHLDLPGQVRVYRLKKELCIRKEALPLRELGKREKRPETGQNQP